MNRLHRFKVSWGNAEVGEADFRLTEEEFMSFRHPESSMETTLAMADHLLNYFGKPMNWIEWYKTCRLNSTLTSDSNDDNRLSESEFLALSKDDGDDDIDDDVNSLSNNGWRAKRRHEFRTKLDLDNDGFATKQELIVRKSDCS